MLPNAIFYLLTMVTSILPFFGTFQMKATRVYNICNSTHPDVESKVFRSFTLVPFFGSQCCQSLQRIHLKQQAPMLMPGGNNWRNSPSPMIFKTKRHKECISFWPPARTKRWKTPLKSLEDAWKTWESLQSASRVSYQKLLNYSGPKQFSDQGKLPLVVVAPAGCSELWPKLFQVILTSQMVGQFSSTFNEASIWKPLNFFDNLRRGLNYMQSGCQHWKRTGRSATAGSEQPKLIADTSSVTNHPYPWDKSQYTETMTTYTKTLVQLLNRFRKLNLHHTKFRPYCLTVFKPCWWGFFSAHFTWHVTSTGVRSMISWHNSSAVSRSFRAKSWSSHEPQKKWRTWQPGMMKTTCRAFFD